LGIQEEYNVALNGAELVLGSIEPRNIAVASSEAETDSKSADGGVSACKGKEKAIVQFKEKVVI